MRKWTSKGTRRAPGVVGRAALGAAGLLTVSAAAFASPASASVTVTSHFVWTPTSSSISSDTTFIANGATNGQPGDLLFVTPNLSPQGISVCPCILSPQSPVGVWYDGDSGQWGVFNENSQPMGRLFSYNVLVVPKAGKSVFVHKASHSNSHGDYTVLSSSLLNRKPTALILITQNYDPNGSGGVYNPHPVGVRYIKPLKKWAIFNEDGAPMEPGAAFNVLVGQHPTNGGSMSLLKTTSHNKQGTGTLISNSQTTGNPNNVTFLTPDFNWDAKGGKADSTFLAVAYGKSREGVLSWDGPAPKIGTEFNLVIFSS
jgi:hypothetical protein